MRKHRYSRTCRVTGKARWADELDAKIALASVHARDSSRRITAEQRSYRCQFCKGWHLTSKPLRPHPKVQDIEALVVAA